MASEVMAFSLVCPVCGGAMNRAFDRSQRSWYACLECDSDVSVPQQAWEVARRKREQKWLAKNDHRRWWKSREGVLP
ncbi:MAG TPA: hypothetical protein VEC39_06340 [Vicinamibacterales bacterium]|nr:hypothetical protein [Vicinamibacterales bacterium]